MTSLLLRNRPAPGLSPALLARLDAEAARRGVTTDAFVAQLLASAATGDRPPAQP